MSARLGWVAAAVLLLLAVAWSARWAERMPPAAALEPERLTLAVDQAQEVRLVSHAGRVVAFAFRLRFDEAVVRVDVPAAAGLLAPHGEEIRLPVVRAPGLVDVAGVAVTGGRKFEPGAALYHFTVRGAGSGKTAVQVEDLRVVDVDETQRLVPVVPLSVVVRPR